MTTSMIAIRKTHARIQLFNKIRAKYPTIGEQINAQTFDQIMTILLVLDNEA